MVIIREIGPDPRVVPSEPPLMPVTGSIRPAILKEAPEYILPGAFKLNSPLPGVATVKEPCSSAVNQVSPKGCQSKFGIPRLKAGECGSDG